YRVASSRSWCGAGPADRHRRQCGSRRQHILCGHTRRSRHRRRRFRRWPGRHSCWSRCRPWRLGRCRGRCHHFLQGSLNMEILTGNELISGATVYLDGTATWVEDLQAARLFAKTEAAERDAALAATKAGGRIISLEIEEIEQVDGQIVP